MRPKKRLFLKNVSNVACGSVLSATAIGFTELLYSRLCKNIYARDGPSELIPPAEPFRSCVAQLRCRWRNRSAHVLSGVRRWCTRKRTLQKVRTVSRRSSSRRECKGGRLSISAFPYYGCGAMLLIHWKPAFQICLLAYGEHLEHAQTTMPFVLVKLVYQCRTPPHKYETLEGHLLPAPAEAPFSFND